MATPTNPTDPCCQLHACGAPSWQPCGEGADVSTADGAVVRVRQVPGAAFEECYKQIVDASNSAEIVVASLRASIRAAYDLDEDIHDDVMADLDEMIDAARALEELTEKAIARLDKLNASKPEPVDYTTSRLGESN